MKSSIRISLIYAFFSSIWILLSDKAVYLITENPALITYYSSVKGLFFVLTTGILLFVLMYREESFRNKIIIELDKGVEVRNQLIQELHHRIKNNIQAVLGLIRIDTRKRQNGLETGLEIEKRLISMLSVYNVVYDYGDMSNITFTNVLREYAMMSERHLTVSGDENIHATIETMVTLLLVVDGIIDRSEKRGVVSGVSIRITPGKLFLVFFVPVGDLDELMGIDRDFYDLFMRSLKGEISMTGDKQQIVLTCHLKKRKTISDLPPRIEIFRQCETHARKSLNASTAAGGVYVRAPSSASIMKSPLPSPASLRRPMISLGVASSSICSLMNHSMKL